MNILKKLLLWASNSQTLRAYLPSFYFVKKAVKRFMPGESFEDAVNAAKYLQKKNLGTVFTLLGENLNNLYEAEKVKDHYLNVLETIRREKINAEISVKLTQLGLDLSFNKAMEYFLQLTSKAKEYGNFVWIDMEGSKYTRLTFDFYLKALNHSENCGVCIQSYLKRSKDDIKKLIDNNSSVRLVKGAYKEPADKAFQKKSEVDKSFIELAELLLNKQSGGRIVFGTHDLTIINNIRTLPEKLNLSKNKYEFHLLYGIKTNEQIKLANGGYNVKVLISYGNAWFPWYMRRLAERPANIGFVLKNIFSR